ncbi:hypothetical protein RN629_17225 [Sphingomonadaceae bacterium jetA1]|jgi:hypothetical protein|uniref:hypothetical protein n=1 Tax=Facivitalis istanbulensis TaxID=3075838 RepID=UPI0034750282
MKTMFHALATIGLSVMGIAATTTLPVASAQAQFWHDEGPRDDRDRREWRDDLRDWRGDRGDWRNDRRDWRGNRGDWRDDRRDWRDDRGGWRDDRRDWRGHRDGWRDDRPGWGDDDGWRGGDWRARRDARIAREYDRARRTPGYVDPRSQGDQTNYTGPGYRPCTYVERNGRTVCR